MRSIRLPQFRSIQAAVVLWVGVSMFLMAAVLIVYSATSLRRVVIQRAEQQAVATAHTKVASITSGGGDLCGAGLADCAYVDATVRTPSRGGTRLALAPGDRYDV